MRSLKTEDGLPLHWRQWSPPAGTATRGTVLLVHGLGEHVGRYEALAGRLNEWGWPVVGYDHRGHGASGGPRGDLPQRHAMLEDLALVVDTLRAEPLADGPLILLGHSMGGLVAARFVAGALEGARWSRPVDGLVLSSPAMDPGLSGFQKALLATSLKVAPHLAVGNGLKPEWISRSAAVVRAYVDDPLVHNRISATLAAMIAEEGREVLRLAPGWTVPTLLMWAGADRCVNPAGSATLAQALPPQQLQAQAFETLFHEIFNEPEREQVLTRLRAWLDARF
ncbi:lysophospholipase [Pelomonas sp. CA6]|uniref:alpha/beta hydrolase n=1 Tax=Pelomonas sp. CA6 TaxID=2907999 RepID=UPI001F4C4E16|nr:alpha/beta hydrolase [Pelomonas sp. CA6]MCH7343496.1 lysophospholipase [Pelomonas sp. CA6]